MNNSVQYVSVTNRQADMSSYVLHQAYVHLVAIIHQQQ